MAIIDKIQISGTNYDIKDASAVTVVNILQADYDELPESAKTSNIIYNITDAPQININEYVSKAENVVLADYMYYTGGNVMSLQIDDNVSFLIISAPEEYKGQRTDLNGYGYAYHDGQYEQITFYLDYVANTADTSGTQNITITYDDDVDDFIVSAVSPFVLTYLNVYGDVHIKRPIKYIPSGQTAQVIRNGIEPLLDDLCTNIGNSVTNVGTYQGDKKNIILNSYRKYADDTSSSISLGNDLKNENGKLVTDIQIPLGVSGWTQINIPPNSCEVGSLQLSPIIKLEYDTTPGNLYIGVNGEWGNTVTYINWYEGSYIFQKQLFDGSHEGFGEATLVHDSTEKIITITFPLTVQPPGYSSPKKVFLDNIGSYACDMGNNVTASTYAELEQDIIPYVQGKQDTLSAGTGIDITNNVISVTGGGGGGSITIDPSLNSGSTNPVANSAITNAINSKVSDISFDTDMGVKRFLRFSTPNSFNKFLLQNFKINGTPVLKDGYVTSDNLVNYNLVPSSAITTSITSSSTDAQVPSAKAVYDQMGGMKIVKLTESEYTALVTKDADTLYIVIPDPSN